jgi:glycosyltransferase involved in cell wall biosynthesis
MNEPPSPAVSIGMPILNGALLMRRAIESVLRQDFTDFELIICDNASSDDTPAIAAEYVARDSRVRHVRRERTTGPLQNFEYALSVARGEMFSWLAYDDTYDRADHLTRLVAKIREGNVLAFPEVRAQYLDDKGAIVRTGHDMLAAFGEITTRKQLIHEALRHASVQVFGLFRADKLREHVHLMMENTDMRCFYESAFLHRFLVNERWAFVPEAVLNVGQHESNTSRIQDPGRLLHDFLLYSARAIRAPSGWSSMPRSCGRCRMRRACSRPRSGAGCCRAVSP